MQRLGLSTAGHRPSLDVSNCFCPGQLSSNRSRLFSSHPVREVSLGFFYQLSISILGSFWSICRHSFLQCFFFRFAVRSMTSSNPLSRISSFRLTHLPSIDLSILREFFVIVDVLVRVEANVFNVSWMWNFGSNPDTLELSRSSSSPHSWGISGAFRNWNVAVGT